MDSENAIRRLMLFLLSAGLILILNVIVVIFGNAHEFWKDMHQIVASLAGFI